MDQLEESSRATAELSVYEDDLEAAKKSKDKAKVKKLEKKMAPLIKTVENGTKNGQTLLNDYWKEKDKLTALGDAVTKANA